MARYTGPDCKLCRREGMKLYLKAERCYTAKCAIERRNSPPGPHVQRRRKVSEFGLQLREKQKARRVYGVLERQFRRHYENASRSVGATGQRLLQILESRLDNVVYRLGIGGSRDQARQIVCHGHIHVNGRKTDIPSFLVKPGDVISIRPESRRRPYFKDVEDAIAERTIPSWLEVDLANLSARVLSTPERPESDPVMIQEQLIVEHYSR